MSLLKSLETSAVHAGIAIEDAFTFLIHFLATNAPALTTAATIAETATGNAALVPVTQAAGAAVQQAAAVLGNVSASSAVTTTTGAGT